MNSRTTARFRRALAGLPSLIRRRARQAYKRFRTDPQHPSLRFKSVHPSLPIYSVRVSKGCRALGRRAEQSEIVWFWIGSHAEYDRLVAQMRKPVEREE